MQENQEILKEILTLELENQSGQKVSLKDKLGAYMVLYFYPKDDTPGCTTEACAFRDANQELKELGVSVLGVSKDSVRSHSKFRDKYQLNFELLSDPEAVLNQAFGVWQEKSFMGRKYMGTVRTTFIIGPDGKILKRYDNVKPEGHAEQVLTDLKALLK